MINLNDFCRACGEGMDVSVSFYDTRDNSFICNVVLYAANKSSTVVLNDAKTGCKTLSAVCGYGYVEYFYVSADVICVKARVHKEDL